LFLLRENGSIEYFDILLKKKTFKEIITDNKIISFNYNKISNLLFTGEEKGIIL